jgi:hypothetical protein
MAKKKPALQRDEIVNEARARYELAQEIWRPIYERCRADMRFSNPTNPEQWPEDAKKERKDAGRPCLTFDQTGQFVRQVINTARRNKPALNFLPVDDKSDPKLADVLKGLARQTEHASRAEVAYITALNHATRGGIGFFRLVLKEVDGEVKGQQCAEIRRVVDFESVLVDPAFTEPDGSDMGWGFVGEDMPREVFERTWPDALPVPFDDSKGWGSDKTVRVCEYYRVVTTEDGKAVEHFKLTGESVLEKSIFPAEFVPLFPVLGNEEWENGKRDLAGCIRVAKDAQITYNFERNAGYEAVAVGPKAPWLAPVEAIEGHEDKWKRANAANIAYLPFNTVDEQGNQLQHKPERVSPAGIAAGWAHLAENSKNDIQAALGGFESGVGNNPNDQSGRAVLALQDRQDVGTFHYVDNLALSIAHCGRVLTQVWPVIYDQKQVVRIIGEEEEPEFVTVDPKAPKGYSEQMSATGQKLVTINPGVGKYDVRAVVGPAFQTKQQEFAAELGEVISGNPQMLSMVGDMWVKARNFPEADKLAKRFKAMLPPQVQQAEGEGQQQIPPEVQMVLQQAQQEIQGLQQQLQEAQSGMAVDFQAQFEAEREATKRYIAELYADTKHVSEELKGMVSLLLQKLQPPPALAAEVGQDIAEQG